MFQTIGIGIYCFLGGLITAALLTDKSVNTNRKEACFCFIAGTLWLLTISIAAGFGLYENIQEKIFTRRQARSMQVLAFSRKLFKMKLISQETLSEVQKRLTK